MQSPIPSQLNDGIRDMVCRVEGPECGGESWVEHERPEEPEEYTFTFTGDNNWDGEVKGEGDARIAIEFALAQLGKPYIWGGNGPHGWDCSGIMKAAWQEAGVSIPRTTTTSYAALPHVSKGELQPGDLVYFHTIASHPSPSHMGMYLGDGQMVHAGDPVQVVQMRGNPYWEQKWVGAARVPQG
ncbi:C40 family peptidase [Halostreptopolyspora alba]|uniref:C40 family peptidase n=1 Tax=Halostreptopolyspora alba TaxID=2487137 RepID=UPI003718C852